MAKQCTTKKRVKDSEWFKDKMLLSQAQEAGVVLDEEQHDFLADSLEETNDCEDIQLQATTNFKAYHIDAYDSDCDAKLQHMQSSWQVCLLLVLSMMTRLHLVMILKHSLSWDIENIVSNNKSYDELKGNNDVISYIGYMLTIGNDEDNYVNQESKSEIESLTSELERYKDRVKVFGYAVKDGHSEQEAYLCRELYITINDRNRKVSEYEK
ncbi:hypothetical protein Tco_0976783 [Tanacetum coccineum]|uniref:Uncharacterized protein n=1 Tax=Tanacetum coccineum TaxID=301880 RepID=A0ABQ5EI80_9ASTR